MRVLIVGIAVWFVLVIGIRITHGGQVLPGTSAAGVALGGATEDEARQRISTFVERPLVLRNGDERIEMPRAQAGLVADVDGTVEDALDAGRSGLLFGFVSTVTGSIFGRDVPLDATIDDDTVSLATASVARRLNVKSASGALQIDASTLEVRTTKPEAGRRVDRDELAKRLRGALTVGAGEVEIPLESRPAPEPAAVEAVAEAARAYLESPLQITTASGSVEVSPERLAPILELRTERDGETVTLGTKRKALAKLVEEVAGEIDRQPRNARIAAPGQPDLFEGKGDLAWKPRPAKVRVKPERTGQAISQGSARKQITGAIAAGRHEVRLELKDLAPAVTADAAKGIDSLIGTFTTRYAPGEPRVTNIRRIAKTIDKTVIAPGAKFSLNSLSGQRTLEKGYVEAPFIAEGRIKPSVGGGVSQFSTTMYNAAYFAGLELNAHRAHSLFIDRYPPGREATLNFPDIDLVWTNDTDVPVFVRATSNETSVTVALYGDNGGRRVKAQTGPRRPFAGGNFQITVTRVVRYSNGKTARQPVMTRYDNPAPDLPPESAEPPPPTSGAPTPAPVAPAPAAPAPAPTPEPEPAPG